MDTENFCNYSLKSLSNVSEPKFNHILCITTLQTLGDLVHTFLNLIAWFKSQFCLSPLNLYRDGNCGSDARAYSLIILSDLPIHDMWTEIIIAALHQPSYFSARSCKLLEYVQRGLVDPKEVSKGEISNLKGCVADKSTPFERPAWPRHGKGRPCLTGSNPHNAQGGNRREPLWLRRRSPGEGPKILHMQIEEYWW